MFLVDFDLSNMILLSKNVFDGIRIFCISCLVRDSNDINRDKI